MTTKTKKETRGRKTSLEIVQEALGTGAPVPQGVIPVPLAIQKLIAGKSATDIMQEAAPYCAHYLYNCIITKKLKPSWPKIDVAKYIIDQVEGKARIRAELSGPGGAPLSWQALVILASKAEAEEMAKGAAEVLPKAEDAADPGTAIIPRPTGDKPTIKQIEEKNEED